jgi:hypothetical protein
MSEPVQTVPLIGKARVAALAGEAQSLLEAGQAKDAVLTWLEGSNRARCRPPLSRRRVQKIIEDVSELRAMNARNRRFWDRRNKHFSLLSTRLPDDLQRAVRIQHDIEPAIQFLSSKIKGDDEESLAAMRALQPLLRLANTGTKLREARIARRAKNRQQVSKAATTRRELGEKAKEKVARAARRVLKADPRITRDDLANEIAPTIGLSVERTIKYLSKLQLFSSRSSARQ